ncbi:MAG: hypothetical protein U0U70_16410 [Chitinophagaceae bacterium]
MEQLKKAGSAPGYKGIELQQLVDGLVGNSLSVAKKNNSIVVNEIDSGVVLQSVDERLLELLNDIFTAVISNSRRGKIHIRAEKYDELLEFFITERNNYNGYALSFSIGALAEEAAELGANLDIKDPQRLETTICLCIPEGIAA